MFTIDRERCVNCGICARTCPMGVIYLDKEGAPAVREGGKCLQCFHCTAACPTQAITHNELGAASLPLQEDDGSMLAKFRRRRSIRRFKPTLPDPAVIRAALDGAAYAPSSKNDRAYQWTVIMGDAVERAHKIYLEWANTVPELRHLVWLDRRGVNPITCGAPCLVAVHCGDDCTNPASDSVIALTLAEQLLNDAGLGTCWGGYFHRASQTCGALRAMLNLPEGHQVYGVLMVGHPDEHFPRDPYRPAATIHWVE